MFSRFLHEPEAFALKVTLKFNAFLKATPRFPPGFAQKAENGRGCFHEQQRRVLLVEGPVGLSPI